MFSRGDPSKPSEGESKRDKPAMCIGRTIGGIGAVKYICELEPRQEWEREPTLEQEEGSKVQGTREGGTHTPHLKRNKRSSEYFGFNEAWLHFPSGKTWI